MHITFLGHNFFLIESTGKRLLTDPFISGNPLAAHIEIDQIRCDFTMDVQEAVIAAGFIRCNNIIGCHYDTFGLIQINHEAAKEAFTAAGVNMLLPEIGETIRI